MSHADGALKVLTAFRQMAQRDELLGSTAATTAASSSELASFAAHAVPVNPDVPMLPPAILDAETVQVLGDNLYQAFENHRLGKTNNTASGAHTRAATNHSAGAADASDLLGNTAAAASTAAAVGVGVDDDDEVDPLEAPAVLDAVRKFREQLTVQQGGKAVKRQQLVADVLAKMLPVVRQRVQEERERGTAPALLLPPPPPPPPSGLLLPPPPPPQPPTLDAPRGVSNKPAWMTQQEQLQQQQQQQQLSEEPPTKRRKTVDVTDPAVVFPVMPEGSVAALRLFIAGRIQHYLGEEEATLIDFVSTRVRARQSVAALAPELSDVLAEDAPAFLQSVYEHCQLLAESGSSG